MRGVDGFWETERAGGRQLERVLPTGQSQVVLDLDNGVAKLVGPRTVSSVVETPRRAAGFSLSGSGLGRIVGGDVHCLVDSAIDLQDLGCDVHQVIDSECDRLTAVRELARRLVGRFEVDDRIVFAERQLKAGFPAQSVFTQLEFDRRTFVPAFRTTVGVAPKHYEILIRFQRTNSLLRSRDNKSLASIAFELGFADQAHMTREMRRLAGLTPSQLQALAPGPANHVPVVDGST